MGNKQGGAGKDKELPYTLDKKLGSGSFAIVYRGISKKKDAQEVAIKIIDKTKLTPQELTVVHDEVEIMRKLKHPACISLLDYIDTKPKCFIVMDICLGGELFDRIIAKGSYSEREAAALVRTIADALVYLHGINVVHRDLKPENLLYSTVAEDSPIKITDFGLAKQTVPGKKMFTAAGTPGYVAPEVLVNKGYGKEVDWWSLGVILYILLCGFPPFYNDVHAKLFAIIKKGKFDFPDPYWSNISADAKDLVSQLLTVDIAKRATGQQVLQHRWVSGSASAQQLSGGYADRMRLLQAKRRLRKGVKVIMALNKFGRALSTFL